MNDPYEILGLSKKATIDKVEKRYRKLQKKYHPELHPDKPEYAAKMREIDAAYDKIRQQNTYTVGDSSTYSESSGMSPLDTVESYLRNGIVTQGLSILNGIDEKSARWYYLASIANSQSGNGIVAVEYAEKAVELEPTNKEYKAVLDTLKAGELAYFQDKSIFRPLKGYPKFVVAMIVAYLLCRFCR